MKEIMKFCDKKRNNMRQAWNHCIGSTTFAGPSPRFMNPYTNSPSMLPRPYVATLKNKRSIEQLWFKQFVLDLSDLTINHIKTTKYIFYEKKYMVLYFKLCKILDDIEFAKSHIPLELRVYDSIFTQTTIVGEVENIEHQMPLHFDKQDVISCIVTLGANVSGGPAIYHSGITDKDPKDLVLSIPFEHGRIQIGTFSSVLHGISIWKGARMTVALNLKREVVSHFRDHGDKFYDQFRDQNYPSKHFMAY